MKLAGGGAQWMLVQNHDFLSATPGEFFELLAEIDFFAGKKLVAETAGLAKRIRLAINKRPRHPMARSADEIPHGGDPLRHGKIALELHSTTARDTVAGFNFADDIEKQL